MADRDDLAYADDALVRALVASSRSERPVDGAQGRAWSAAVRELGLGMAEARRGARSLETLRVAVSGLALAVALVAGGVFTLQTQAREQRDAAQTETRRLDALLKQRSEQAAQIEAELRSELASERNPTAIVVLEERLDAQKQALMALQPTTRAARPAAGAPAAAGGGGRGGGAAKACSCTPGDPLCSCL